MVTYPGNQKLNQSSPINISLRSFAADLRKTKPFLKSSIKWFKTTLLSADERNLWMGPFHLISEPQGNGKANETTKRTLSEAKQLKAYESLYLFLWHAKSARKQPFPVSSSFESLRKDIFYCKKNTFRFSLDVFFDGITLLNFMSSFPKEFVLSYVLY